MNRAERRRQKKLADKVAKSAKTTHSTPDLPDQPMAAVQQDLNLALQLLQSGNLTAANSAFQQILKKDPNQADALQFLGVIAHQQGNNDLAVEMIKKAVAIQPENANTHGNLGIVLKAQGKLDEAVASYRLAIAANPGYAEAHSDLGSALKEQGNLDEAASSFRRAIALKPDYTEAHYNMGLIQHDLGRAFEAFASFRKVATLQPQNSKAWAGMALTLRSLSFTSIDDSLLSDIELLLDQPNVVSPWHVVKPVLSALYCLPGFAPLVEQTANNDPDRPPFTDSAARLSAIPLFLRIMSLCPINDLQIEHMLTRLRRALLTAAAEDAGGDDNDSCTTVLPFALSLALHCFTNEYIYPESNEETQVVDALALRVADRVKQKQVVPGLWLAALATFRPLYSLGYAEQLLDLSDQGILNDLLRRQITEPFAERALRHEIHQLTPINNSVSQLVRAQYEESPYPRWIHTQQTSEPQVIEDYLQKAPLSLDLGDYQSPDKPEILIAGCGTGQHSLNTASRFKNAQVLAIDLSLSSLSYAIRKTRELGVTNVTYGQADIMELGSLGRQFDVIESAGVLHHLGDPIAGWKVLVDLLRPGGLMRIALYSEQARKAVTDGRTLITNRGYSTSLDDIRRCRQEIIKRVTDGDQALAKVPDLRDFYSLSECRDLLFHVQEHRFTLVQIKDALISLNLTFLGMDVANQSTLNTFRETNPEQTGASALSLWHQFEQNNPDTFKGMYQFWCRKT